MKTLISHLLALFVAVLLLSVFGICTGVMVITAQFVGNSFVTVAAVFVVFFGLYATFKAYPSWVKEFSTNSVNV